MKQNKTAILVLLALVALMICAGILYSRLSSGFSMDVISSEAADPSASEEELTPAPDFTVYDSQGNEVSLSDFRGKPVVLNFWASWCGPCKREMPDFESIYQELGEDVEFMMVNVTDGSRETRDSAAEFIAGEGYTFPVYYDAQLDGVSAYGLQGFPTTFYLNADREVMYGVYGMMSEEYFYAYLYHAFPELEGA